MFPAHDPPLVGATLPQWLDRLDAEGFHIGVRERLVAHELLARLATSGELPRTERQALALLAPLLCTSPESQRRYTNLLQQFVMLQPQQRPPQAQAGTSGADRQQRGTPWSNQTKLGLAALLLVACIFAAIRFMLAPQASPAPVSVPQASATIASPPASQQPPTMEIARPIYVPLQPLQIQFEPVAPAWSEALRIVLVTLGALCLLALAGVAWMRLQRALYLHGTRSDEDLQAYVLSDLQGPAVPAPAALLRTVARGLRQHVAGERETLDLKATLEATVRAAGAFSPRLRRQYLTPEYVALIDRRHPLDHQAAWSESLLQALQAYGVTVHVWYFEGTPLHGCWRLRQSKSSALESVDRLGMAELAARHAGHRLLVLGEAQALVEPLTGSAQTWSRELNAFPQRAWFTPQPIVSWGAAEQLADAQGFLVLPLQPEALVTLTNWLASEDLSLAVGADWPLAYPPLLAQDGTAWVARQAALPPPVLDNLLFQLRAYLGAERFQWLCACAIFPALSPPLTLALGHVLTDDPRRLALGMTALGTLPWFRHGHMPEWLRMALVERLDNESEKRFRAATEQRLAQALENQCNVLVTLAVRRRLSAWLARGRGVARDVVLVSFLHRNAVSRLAQRLPDALKQRLFRNGLPLQGLRQGILIFGLLPGAMLVGVAIPKIWQAVRFLNADGPTLAAVGGPRSTNRGPVLSVAFSPDGRRIVSGESSSQLSLFDTRSGQEYAGEFLGNTWGSAKSAAFSPDGSLIAVGFTDNTIQVRDARDASPIGDALKGHTGAVQSVAFSHDSQRIVSGSLDKTIRMWDASSGKLIGGPLLGHTDAVNSIAISFGGTRIVSGSTDKSVRLWDVHSGQPIGMPLQGHTDSVTSVAFNPNSSRIASSSADNTVRLWAVPSGRPIGAPLRGHTESVTSVAFSPDGRYIVSGSADKTVRLWDAGSGEPIGAPLRGHKDSVTSVAFSPDGSRIVSGSMDNTVRVWGRLPARRIDLVDCGKANPYLYQTSRDVRFLANAIASHHQFDARSIGNSKNFDIAAYIPSAWRRLHTQQIPGFKEILYARGNQEQESVASALKNWLMRQTWPESQNSEIESFSQIDRFYSNQSSFSKGWLVRAADPNLEAVVVNACPWQEISPRSRRNDTRPEPVIKNIN